MEHLVTQHSENKIWNSWSTLKHSFENCHQHSMKPLWPSCPKCLSFYPRQAEAYAQHNGWHSIISGTLVVPLPLPCLSWETPSWVTAKWLQSTAIHIRVRVYRMHVLSNVLQIDTLTQQNHLYKMIGLTKTRLQNANPSSHYPTSCHNIHLYKMTLSYTQGPPAPQGLYRMTPPIF